MGLLASCGEKMLKLFKSLFCKKTKFHDKSVIPNLPPIPKGLVNQAEATQRALELNENPLAKIKRVYDFTDKFTKFASQFTVCEKGCNYCCQIGVTVTTLEAKYIEANTNYKIKTNNQPRPDILSPCPLLSDTGMCSVYEFRPMNCRTFHALDDPKYCKTGEEHQIYGVSGGEGIPIVLQFSRYIQQLNGRSPSKDIRDFFG